MTVWFVSRHPGAKVWAQEEGLCISAFVDHLDPATVVAGDVAIGSLPIHLAAAICAQGGTYRHLSLNLTAELRGVEISSDEMRLCGAKIEEFSIVQAKEIG